MAHSFTTTIQQNRIYDPFVQRFGEPTRGLYAIALGELVLKLIALCCYHMLSVDGLTSFIESIPSSTPNTRNSLVFHELKSAPFFIIHWLFSIKEILFIPRSPTP